MMLAATLPDNGGYVAAACLILVLMLLVYLAIMANKLSKIERDTNAVLKSLAQDNHEAQRQQHASSDDSPAPTRHS
jgi:hypothetical protein